MVCLIYLDDYLFFAKEMPLINEMIKNFQKNFVLEHEEDVTAFLEIEFPKHDMEPWS